MPDTDISLAGSLNVCLSQVAVNRSRLRGVVDALLRDMPAQQEAAKHREEGIEFARQYHNVSAATSQASLNGCLALPRMPPLKQELRNTTARARPACLVMLRLSDTWPCNNSSIPTCRVQL